ncbi:TOMM precursor leader peptide-binding protein [Streptomyces sp. NBC_00893]|uniref:TOMM precursor leader peptide-binding protein n=1 Tax=Streptomyces sp. NBC_00893 TaxID=2975862 RepID=UPI0022584233|nr:TOMM precursor leader peptide-binding protein [Streptomyces sp. NBC_00893]MCX4847520.1 TOMM precursor leader peptide-binding protein [Streptomyces sp. NBC_00893]
MAETATTERAPDAAPTADPARPAPAASAFDTLAGTRPRIRRDVLFTETRGGVLFHNADGGFHLTGRTAYRFASLVVPHLTGDHRLADLCAGFGPAQRAMAAELVRTLYARDFARDVPPPSTGPAPVDDDVAERFAAQIAYIDHYTDEAPERFARFRATRVAVLGDDETARWCALSLLRNGCVRIGTSTAFDDVTAEAGRAAAHTERITAGAGADWAGLDGYDIVVVTGAGAGARTHRLLAAGVPEGRTLIPAWLFGERLIVGPRSTAASTGCWSCAVLRLGGNVDAGAAAELWSAAAGAVPAATDTVTGPVAAMVGNLLGYEIFRLTTGALPAETEGQVLIQDLASLDVMAEPVAPHPRCARCAGPVAAASAAARPDGLALPVTATVETARDAEELVDELNRRGAAMVRPHTGIFRSWDDEALTQTPLKISRIEVALGAGERRRIAAFDVHHLAGARTRALYAAAVAYVEHVVPLDASASAPETGQASETAQASAAARVPGAGAAGRVLGPDALTTGGGTGAVPAAWTTATSLTGGETVRVPAAAVRPFGAYNRDRVHLATAAGSGAGADAREAAGTGLMSALAHDALLRAVRSGTEVRPVAADGDDPELVFLLKSAANLDLAVELLDLGEQARTTAQVVLAREADGGAARGRWAVGAGLSRRAAACAALRDLLGQAQLAAEDPGTPVDTGDPLVRDLAAASVAVTGEPVAVDGPDTTFEAVLYALRAAGRDALYVPTTPADLAAGGISTARVLLTADGGAADAEGGSDAR